MDLKSQQEAYTILYFNQSEEQHGIRVQVTQKKTNQNAKIG